MTDEQTGAGDVGYPPSAPRDLNPGPDLIESLADADRDVEAGGQVAPQGRRPDGSVEDDDALDDAHDIDALADAEANDHRGGGAGPQDAPNFNDNAAEWSREGK